MKPYLVVTGTLFALFAAFHIWATVTALHRFTAEPGLVLGRGGIALATGGLSLWAWRLLRSRRR
jgi:hypothetical protein